MRLPRSSLLATAVLGMAVLLSGPAHAQVPPGEGMKKDGSNATAAALQALVTANGGGSLVIGGALTGITSLGLRDTSAAFDVTLRATSSTTLTAGRALTLDVVNASRTLKLGANLTIASDPGAVSGALKSNGTGTFSQAAFADVSGTAAQTQLPSGYAAPTNHGIIIGQGASAPVAVGPCGTANQIVGYPTISADPQCVSHMQTVYGQAGTQAQNTTVFLIPGGTTLGSMNITNSSQAGSAPYAITLRNLYVKTAAVPASGQTFTFTVYTASAPGVSGSASTITCQMTNSSNPIQCTDLAHSVSVPAGGVWAVQVATSATSGSTGNITWAIEQDTP